MFPSSPKSWQSSPLSSFCCYQNGSSTVGVQCIYCSKKNCNCFADTRFFTFFFFFRQDKQVVEVDLSLDVQFCEVSLIDLHWKNSRPALHHALLSNISICQCTAQQTNFSIIASSSGIILQDSNISRCSGYQMGLPFLSVTSLPGYQNTLQIINCNIFNNFGPVLFVGNVQHASIILSHLEGNKVSAYGKIITAQVSHVKISGTRFIRNTGTLLGLDDGDSSASLEVSVEMSSVKPKLCMWYGAVLERHLMKAVQYAKKCMKTC